MPPYYDVYIGGNKYKLYLKDEPFDVVMEDSKGTEPYGKLLCTYNEATQVFSIKIANLSQRGRCLLEHKFLHIAISVSANPIKYQGSPSAFRRGDQYRTRNVLKKYRGGYYATGAKGAEEYGVTYKRVENISDEIEFYADEIPLRTRIRSVKNLIGDPFEIDVKFILWSSKGSGRAHKTICDKFALTV